MLTPEPHAIAVILLTVVALFLFTRERIPLETSALAILMVLATGFSLFPYSGDQGVIEPVDFFLGFGHEALIAVSALMIAGHGMVRTGALEPVGRILTKLWGISPALSLLATLVVAGILSAFINNTPIVVLLLPILVSISLRTKTSPSSMLMPMGFATLLGGTSTTIGTSTNLLVVGVAADLGLRKLGMFDFFLPAFLAGTVGMAWLWLVAPRILPKREPVMTDLSPRVFTTQFLVGEDSPSANKTLSELIAVTGGAMKVDKLRRSESQILFPLPDARVLAGDRLLVHDTPSNLKMFESELGVRPYSAHLPDGEVAKLDDGDQQLAEILVFRGSPLENRTAQEVRLTDQFDIVILAIHRAGHEIRHLPHGIQSVRLMVGDVLLIQGGRERIAKLRRDSDFMVLDATTDLPYTRKAPFATAVMLGIILVAGFGILPISVSAPLGVLIMLMCTCLSWRDVSQALNVQVILIIVASLALGNALLLTGGSDFLASVFVSVLGDAPPAVIISALLAVMAVMTNLVSNNAAAVIGTPIAISMAETLQLPAEAFVLAVLFGANMSYATPMAYQTNLLVMSAGNYKFMDFVRVGLPLILLMWLAYSFLLPWMYL